jgi:short-subunit dehydrogenase
VVAFARRQDRLDALVRLIESRGGRATAVAGDVTRPDDAARLAHAAVETFGRLDVMICNAGIAYHGTLDDTPVEVMRRLVDVNVLGTFYTARAALEVFRRQGSGHLIAVSSIAGKRGVGGTAIYSATKAAQIGMIEAMRAEFVGTGLNASLVYPVSTVTELREAELRDYGRDVEGHGPQQSADEVARAIVEGIVRPRPEIYPHRTSKALAVANSLAPGVVDRLVRRFGRKVTPPVSS